MNKQLPIILGSRALAFHLNIKLDDSKDLDIVSNKPIEIEGYRIDSSTFEFLNNSDILNYCDGTTVFINNTEFLLPSMKCLAMIKRSHLWRNYFFEKHIAYYHKYLAKHLVNLNEFDKKFLTDRIKLTKETVDKDITPSLNKSVDDFFNDNVTKIYNHDHLHELFAHYDKPLYTMIQKDPTKAWCNKDLWDNLSTEDKSKCVAEETYVIATERYIAPKNWNTDYKLAFVKALWRVSTTLTSGWFRDHAIDHYPDIIKLFNKEKIEQVKLKLTT